ncbi:MAG: protein translocase subunit SecD [Planctomycetes bacterium]|nr:protein translocase subunit SecD [Planctomycetota bacterium]
MVKNIGSGIALVVIVAALAVWAVSDPKNIPLGIDLAGGTELRYLVEKDPVAKDSLRQVADQVRDILAQRLDMYGLREIGVTRAGVNGIIVQVPGAGEDEVRRIKDVIEKSGQLVFHIVCDDQDQSDAAKQLARAEMERYRAEVRAWSEKPEPERGPQPLPPKRIVVEEYKRNAKTFEVLRDSNGKPVVDKEMLVENTDAKKISGRGLRNVAATLDDRQLPAIAFEFKGKSVNQFGALTTENKGKRLGIVLDHQLISAPVINNAIWGSGIIEGVGESEVRGLITVLKSGQPTGKPQLENEQTVGSVIGRESIVRGVQAMCFGLAAVVLFLAIYYMTLGVVADLALLLNVLLSVAALVVFRNTLTFPGLAGLLLSVGMSIDANILIFERIREERARGRSLNQSVTGGFDRAFSTIFDSNLTTLITSFILFQFGTGPVKGFAIVLGIGIICSFFTAVYVSRLLISILLKYNLVQQFNMLQFFKLTSIDFMKPRKLCATVSVILIVLGLGVFFARGTSALGIDFTGGTLLVVNLNGEHSASEVQDALSTIVVNGERPYSDVQVQAINATAGERAYTFAVRTQVTPDTVSQAQADTGDGKLGAHELKFVELVRDALGKGQILAPEPFGPLIAREGPTPAEKYFEVTVNLVRRDGGLGPTASDVRALLESGSAKIAPLTGYEVAEINQEAPNPRYATFRINKLLNTAAKEAQSFEADVKAIFDAQKASFPTAAPFGAVETISGKVAADLQQAVFVAMMMSFLAIIFYVALRFQLKFGLAAVVPLVHDVLFSLGAVAVADIFLGEHLNLKVNLPVMAALLTTVGFSINDTIVIFDRIRENIGEKKRDLDFIKIVNDSVNQTLGRTLLTAGMVFLTTLALLIWGGDSLHGFSFTFLVGVIAGTYSSIYIASPLVIYFNDRAEKRRARRLAASG